GEDAVHPLQGERDPASHGKGAAALAGSRPAGRDGDGEARGEAKGFLYVLARFGEDHRCRREASEAGGVARVGIQALGIPGLDLVGAEGANQRVQPLAHRLPIRRTKRSRRSARSANSPVKASVIAREEARRSPRMVMQLCSASRITAAPRAPSSSRMLSAISRASVSWRMRRWECTSTNRASREKPTIFPAGR